MKTTISLHQQLGINQEMAALLIGVTRVQLALYETGKRDIPLQAKMKLAKMVAFMNLHQEKTITEIPFLAEQELKKEARLKQQMIIYEHKQLLVARKLKRIENNYNNALKSLMLVQYLKSEVITTLEVDLCRSIESKAHIIIKKNGLDIQELHKMKLEAIQEYLQVLKRIEKTINKRDNDSLVSF